MLRIKLRGSRFAAWMLLAALAGAGSGPSGLVARAAAPPPLELPPESAPSTPAPAPAVGNVTSAPTVGNVTTTPEPPEITTDPDGQAIVEGNTTIFRKGVVYSLPSLHASIEAPEIIVHNDTGNAEATGDVKLTREAMRVLAHKIAYDNQQRELASGPLRLGRSPLYLDGTSFEITAQQGIITNPTLFFSEPDPFGLNLSAERAVYNGTDQSITLDHAWLRIGSIPFFYIPEYTQHREDEPPLSIQAHFGFRNDLGGFGQTTTFWTKNPVIWPGLLLDYYSKRGVLVGPALKYHYTDNPDWMQDGTFESGYIHDYGNRGTDLNSNPIPTNRFFADWQHHGSIGGLFDITSSMYWWRDSYVLRDFRQGQWQDNQLPDNFVEAVRREENAFISAFVRYRPNNFETVQERLPEVRFDYMPTPLLQTGIYQEGQASFVQLVENSLNGTPTLHSNRYDAYYGWRRPVNIGDAVTVTPVVGTRVTHYADTLNQQGQFTRMLAQVGFDAEMRALGRWDFDNDTWNIHGVQHILRPVLMYRYIPAAQQGQGLIPAIDDDTFSPYPPIMDLGNTRSVDQLFATNKLRYGVENIIQTRDPVYGSRDLASLNVYNDVNFNNVPGEHQFSNLWTTFGVHPAEWLGFEVFNRFDPAVVTEREVRTRLSVTDADIWSASFYTDNLQHSVAQYWLEARYRLSERYQFIGRWRYDQHLGSLTNQTYGIRTRLGNSWDVEYQIYNNRNAQNQNGIGVSVRFGLLAF